MFFDRFSKILFSRDIDTNVDPFNFGANFKATKFELDLFTLRHSIYLSSVVLKKKNTNNSEN